MRRVVTDELYVFLISTAASLVPVTAHGIEGPRVGRVTCLARTVVRFRHLAPKAQKSKVIL